MRPVVMKNKNHQDISTGHAGFDRQTTALRTGNISGGTQEGVCIRPFMEPADPQGRPCEPGAMQDHDLRTFNGLPKDVMNAVLLHAHEEIIVLHRFFHGHDDARVVHGYVLTRTQEKMYELLAVFDTGPGPKSRDVVATAAEYVSNPPGTLARIEAVGAGIAEDLEDRIKARPETADRLLGLIGTLAQNEDALAIGPRILRGLVDRDFRVDPKNAGQEAVSKAVSAEMAGLSTDERFSLASAVVHLEAALKDALPPGSDGPEEVRGAMRGLIRARGEMALVSSPSP